MDEEKYLFSKKLICGYCNWRMRARMDRYKKIYICSKYNYNRSCVRNKIHEETLINFLETNSLNIDQINLLEIKDKKITLLSN